MDNAANTIAGTGADFLKSLGESGLYIIGNYEVLEMLGAGGMGTVYKARHRRMKRVVALKVLSKAACKSPTFLARFQREVEVISRLTHPNIVMAFDADEADVGPFLVMEFVNGRDLASEVQKRGPLPLREAVAALVQSGRALQYSHAQKIIHRDIKPANLLRDVSGVVKVADLGLARFNEAVVDANAGLTQSGGIVGTVDYMPPEQAFDSASIDFRADIYSLGCTLHYLLTGRPPYQGESLMAIFLKHREGEIPSISGFRQDVPAPLEAIFRKAVAKKPGDRFASMADMVNALEALGLTDAAGLPLPTPVAATFTNSADSGLTLDMPGGLALPPVAKSEAVLLVEPSRTQANIIRKFLTELGWANVIVTVSGVKTLAALHESKPEAVVSSMHLDDMTGAQLLQKIRSEPIFADVGFVLVTAGQNDTMASLGIDGIRHAALLPKPFDREALGRALSAAHAIS